MSLSSTAGKKKVKKRTVKPTSKFASPIPVYTAKDIASDGYLKMLLMGPPKGGKSSTVATTAPKPIFILNGDGKDGLHYASTLPGAEFESGDVNTLDDLGRTASWLLKRVDAGEIRTVVIDTLTLLQSRIVDNFAEANGGVDLQGWGELFTKIKSVIQAFIDAPCHFIIVGHAVNTDGGSGGHGTMPAIAGKLGTILPAMIHEWVWLDVDPKKKPEEARTFLVGPQGNWMHGCRHAKRTVAIEADIGALLEELEIDP